jgi:hypothetical protein
MVGKLATGRWEPTGPARSGRPDDKLRETIQSSLTILDCFVASRNDDTRKTHQL